MVINNSTYSEIQQEFLVADAANRGNKWETLRARVTPEEKAEIYTHCKAIVRLPYSVITRLIWRRIIAQYRTMPNVQHDAVTEVNQAVDDVMLCIPVIRQQRQQAVRNL